LALQRGHTRLIGLMSSFGMRVGTFGFAIRKHLIPHPFAQVRSEALPQTVWSRKRTGLALTAFFCPSF
jgi:hypothetical protein